LTTEELARQMAVWHRILPRSQRRIFLDAALPVPHLIKQVETHVLDLNARRPE